MRTVKKNFNEPLNEVEKIRGKMFKKFKKDQTVKEGAQKSYSKVVKVGMLGAVTAMAATTFSACHPIYDSRGNVVMWTWLSYDPSTDLMVSTTTNATNRGLGGCSVYGATKWSPGPPQRCHDVRPIYHSSGLVSAISVSGFHYTSTGAIPYKRILTKETTDQAKARFPNSGKG